MISVTCSFFRMDNKNELNVFGGAGPWIYLQIEKKKEKIGFGLEMKKMKEY